MLNVTTLIELGEKTAHWIALVVERRKERDEQQAAGLLATAGVLLAAMRTLDNSFREVVHELTTFHKDWPDERRDKVIAQINHFAHEQKILPIIRQYLEQLRGILPTAADSDRYWASKLDTCANDILSSMTSVDITPFPDIRMLRDFLGCVRTARTDEGAEAVMSKSEEALKLLDAQFVQDADHAFGALKGCILQRYQKLPDPGWSVSVSA